MVIQIIGTRPGNAQVFRRDGRTAADLGAAERGKLSVEVLAKTQPVSHLAAHFGVSRKFLYQQAAKASAAIEDVFAPSLDDKSVLFTLPITKDWLRQFTLAQVLIGHTSFRGVTEILDAVFDYGGIGIGTIHNIVQDAILTARTMNDAQDLSAIGVGAHDEIFQAGKPVLVGMDVKSTYCYLLAEEDHRDATTWGVHLLDLAACGLRPDRTIADGGKGLRAGQAEAWGPDVPCNGDVFHAERELGKLAVYLAHRAAGCTRARQKLEHQMERCKKKGQGQTLSKRLALARKAEAAAIALSDDVAALAEWTRNDILSLAGPSLPARRELFDFVVEELRAREAFNSHRIRPVRRMLEGQRDNLLAFAGILDERFAELAIRWDVPLPFVHAICELQGLDRNLPAYWQREGQLRKKLRHKFHAVEQAVRELLTTTPRASSIVENLNSRLRNYFFLRRHIGNGYLDLLRFFLNHRRYIRSERPERVGKSPAELLNGPSHPHWLELLGFERFQQN
jgi:hypothetical protein